MTISKMYGTAVKNFVCEIVHTFEAFQTLSRQQLSARIPGEIGAESGGRRQNQRPMKLQ